MEYNEFEEELIEAQYEKYGEIIDKKGIVREYKIPEFVQVELDAAQRAANLDGIDRYVYVDFESKICRFSKTFINGMEFVCTKHPEVSA